jgi:long-chain acyl-CoA synthetase
MPLLTDSLDFGTIYFRDKTYPPDVVRANIDAVADYLNKKTISNSPFVYLFAPNHIKMVYALFGIIKSGRICVLVDPKLGKLELADMLRDTAPSVLIHIDKATDTFDFSKEFEFKHYKLGEKRLQGLEDVCLIVYTAAMDGYAKGAMLTNENILSNARALIEANHETKQTASCAIIAFHHLFALQTGLLAPSFIQSDVLIVDTNDFKSIRNIAAQLKKYKVDLICTVPLVFYFLRKVPEIKDILSSAKLLVSGGYKLSSAVFNAYKTDFGKEIHEGYGLTEASPICICHRPNDKIKVDSVGRAFPGCEIVILDDKGRTLPEGQIGEICIKGKSVFKGYYNNTSATDEVFKDGVLHTGDFGKTDNEGYFYLTGIKKNMLNISGNKVYPAEVERYMKTHKNVISATISSKPDAIHDRFTHAVVKLRDNSTEAQVAFAEWCDENIGVKKLPKKVEFES